MTWYMSLNKDNEPNGWLEEPFTMPSGIPAIQVDDAVRSFYLSHDNCRWFNGVMASYVEPAPVNNITHSHGDMVCDPVTMTWTRCVSECSPEVAAANLAAARAALGTQVEAESDRRVSALAPPRKVARALTDACFLNRSAIKALVAHHGEPTVVPLTPEEEADALLLEGAAVATKAIRAAEVAIIAEVNVMTAAQISALAADWVTTHAAWPAPIAGPLFSVTG